MEKNLPPIPSKRYFTIGEVGELCGVKPHVLRYWEQEFTKLRPMKRRGNRRYYQHHEVLMIRRIRELLYDQGFTISGARNKLQEVAQFEREKRLESGESMLSDVVSTEVELGLTSRQSAVSRHSSSDEKPNDAPFWYSVKIELIEIRSLLSEIV